MTIKPFGYAMMQFQAPHFLFLNKFSHECILGRGRMSPLELLLSACRTIHSNGIAMLSPPSTKYDELDQRAMLPLKMLF